MPYYLCILKLTQTFPLTYHVYMASTHVSCLNISNYKVDTSPALDNWEGRVAKFLPNQTCGSILCSGNKRASKGTLLLSCH